MKFAGAEYFLSCHFNLHQNCSLIVLIVALNVQII
jgi:hypothetical protein